MSRLAAISPVWGCKVEDLRAIAKIAEDGGLDGI